MTDRLLPGQLDMVYKRMKKEEGCSRPALVVAGPANVSIPSIGEQINPFDPNVVTQALLLGEITFPEGIFDRNFWIELALTNQRLIS